MESAQVRQEHDVGHQRGAGRPYRDAGGSIWFFTYVDNDLVGELKGQGSGRAIATFTARGHDLYAAVHGDLSVEIDRSVIDRLWNSEIGAWYDGGKNDPRLAVLRLDPDRGQVWADTSGVSESLQKIVDPKPAKDDVAKVHLR